ncbi:hypothetical protein [Solicola sp. PLA-1-18]|uniref:hypothetical protein n=1 Tax=Solicola sp. PLA-1-18 TaxID=3380532 RepID=UPI003B769158
MRRLLLVVLTVAVTVGLAGAPASAQTKVRKDKIGDAVANVDIRSAKVQNNSRNYAVTVRVQRVQRGVTGTVVLLLPAGAGNPDDATIYGVATIPISGGRYSTQLFDLGSELDDEDRVSCPGLTSRVERGARGYVRTTVPQSCLGSAAGTLAALVGTFDKRDAGFRTAMRAARRGDEPTSDTNDVVDSFITTRRG